MESRITVAGDIGSGKSTLAKRLGEAVGVEVLSTGAIQRKLAKKMGLSVLELNRLADVDPRIDDEIDGYLKKLNSDKAVVESRLAWHFVKNSLKVYLYCSKSEAARRILAAERADEAYSSDIEALENILARRKSEIARFQARYGVNIADLRNYDVVIDTTFAKPERVFQMVNDHQAGENAPVCWIDRRNIFPTQSIRDLNVSTVNELEAKLSNGWSRGVPPIFCVFVNHVFYVVDGHARFAAGARQGVDLLPVVVAAYGDEPYLRGLSARTYVSDAIRDSLVYDWEDALGIKYPDETWKTINDGSTPVLRKDIH